MPEYETYSKRQARLSYGGEPVLFNYDVPLPLRLQIIHIWLSAFGRPDANKYRSSWYELWLDIHDTIALERGVLSLISERKHLPTKGTSPYEACEKFFLSADTPGALDIIDYSFHVLEMCMGNPRSNEFVDIDAKMTADVAIAHLNRRFLEHAIGFRFAGGELIRVDSEYLQSEAVEPALSLLHRHGFIGTEEEFLDAHLHYRRGENNDAILSAAKAFESCLKTIFDIRGWPYPQNAAAKDLIKIAFDNELVPIYLQASFGSLKSLLECTLPTTRNKTAGHGQGATSLAVPDYLAAFALHTAASTIVLLVEAHEALA